MKTRLFITGLAFFALTTIGFSQNGQPQERPCRNQGNCPAWIDENKNGICDNYENRTPGQGKGNGNGHCCGRSQGQHGRGMMTGQGRGMNFVDENKNGICDRYETAQKNPVEKK
jgi:hypothetical protein